MPDEQVDALVGELFDVGGAARLEDAEQKVAERRGQILDKLRRAGVATRYVAEGLLEREGKDFSHGGSRKLFVALRKEFQRWTNGHRVAGAAPVTSSVRKEADMAKQQRIIEETTTTTTKRYIADEDEHAEDETPEGEEPDEEEPDDDEEPRPPRSRRGR